MSKVATRHEGLEHQEQRIIDRLEERREDLETIAETDTALGSRARHALEWLDERTEGDDA